MSQIGVVHYNNNNNANSQKLNVLQQQSASHSNSNNAPTNNSKSDRRIIVLRKPPLILPQPKDDVLLTNPGRKKANVKETTTKTNQPQPIAVARRNARERNRVKQVNNGFANLRQHIPSFIAQAFENGNGRGNKKLSKVETLRMAVEYIRSLEEILAMDGVTFDRNEKEEEEDELDASKSLQSINSEDINYAFSMSPSDEDDDFSRSPQQYIKINTLNNTYEIVPYENGENLDPILAEHNLLDPNLDLANQDLTYLQVNPVAAAALSPAMYSENSLSPNLSQNCFIPVFATGRLSENFNVHIKNEDLMVKNEEQWWDEAPEPSSS